VAVQQGGQAVGVGQDAGDVGGGREGADQQPPASVAGQLGLQLVQVDLAVAVLADGDDLGGRLAPGEQVGVVLVGAHEHHRPVAGRAGPAVQLQQADQLGHGRRRPRPAEDDQVLCGPAHGLVDHLAGLLAQPRRVVSGARALGVGVGVPGQDPVADGVLDEAQGRPEAVQSA
jgi:hypothetical protein